MAEEVEYAGDSATAKRIYDDDELEAGKQKARQMAARLFSPYEAVAKRSRVENGASADAKGFSYGSTASFSSGPSKKFEIPNAEQLINDVLNQAESGGSGVVETIKGIMQTAHDTDHYVTKSPEELEHETDIFLARFLSNYVRLRAGFGHGPQARLDTLQEHERLKKSVKGWERKERLWKSTERTLHDKVTMLEKDKEKVVKAAETVKLSLENDIALLKEELKRKEKVIELLSQSVIDRDAELENLNERLNVANNEAAGRVALGYDICFQKFADAGADVTGKSWEEYRFDIRSVFLYSFWSRTIVVL